MVELGSGSHLGRYRILHRLGAGAMGEVFLAEDPRIGRQVALKILKIQGLTPRQVEDRRQRMEREARATGQLLHQNVVALFDVGQEGDHFFLAFEYVEGQDLMNRMTAEPALHLREVLEMLLQVSTGLAAAHEQGIVHRDIKPSNVLIDSKGRVKVADFGIAKMASQNTELTQEGSVVGSPQYLSPEQVRGADLDGRSDLFSLGVMLYEILSGNRPFKGETVSTLIYQILQQEPIPLGQLGRNIPEPVVALVQRLMAKNPEDRPTGGDEVVLEFEKLLESLPPAVLDAPLNRLPDPTLVAAPQLSTRLEEAPTVASSPEIPPPPPAQSAAHLGAAPPPTPVPPPANSGFGAQSPGFGRGNEPLPMPGPTPTYSTPGPKGSWAWVIAAGAVGLAITVVLLWMWSRSPDKPVVLGAQGEQAIVVPEASNQEALPKETENKVEVEPPEEPPWVPEEEAKNDADPKTQRETVEQKEPPDPKVGEIVEKDRPAEKVAPPPRKIPDKPAEKVVSIPTEVEKKAPTPPSTSPWPGVVVHRDLQSQLNLSLQVQPDDTFVAIKTKGDRRFLTLGRARDWNPLAEEGRSLTLPSAGEHLLRFRRAGHDDLNVLVKSDGGEGLTTVRVNLRPRGGEKVAKGDLPRFQVREAVSFKVEPREARDGTRIILDGSDVGSLEQYKGGAGDSKWLRLSTGTHRISVRSPGFLNWDLLVEVKASAEERREKVKIQLHRQR